ncbi:MAG: hypothetical protein ACE14M_11255 [Terriglobales bacterium]
MKLKLFVIALGIAFLVPALPAQTATNTAPVVAPPVHRPLTIRERNRLQQKRIREGVKSGSLTAGEAARLERQERQLYRREARMAASGGKLTRGERIAIQRQQDAMSRKIYRAKHNGQHQ